MTTSLRDIPAPLQKLCGEWYSGRDSEMYRVAFQSHGKVFELDVAKLRGELTSARAELVSDTDDSQSALLEAADALCGNWLAAEKIKSDFAAVVTLARTNGFSFRGLREALADLERAEDIASPGNVAKPPGAEW